MIRCPYCGSHNVVPLPLGDYLCLDCEEQFNKGERAPRHFRKIVKFSLRYAKRHSLELANLGKVLLPAILKGAKVFF